MNKREMIAEVPGEKGAFHSFIYFTSVSIEKTPYITHIRFKNNGATVAAFILYQQEKFPTINAMLWPHIQKRTCRGCPNLYNKEYCIEYQTDTGEFMKINSSSRPMWCTRRKERTWRKVCKWIVYKGKLTRIGCTQEWNFETYRYCPACGNEIEIEVKDEG